MKCPNDNATLLITERQGIEIDYCPECRGVWLDRGELDKLIERGSGASQATTERPIAPSSNKDRHEDRDDYYKRDYHGDEYKQKRKKESFLGDLFDF